MFHVRRFPRRVSRCVVLVALATSAGVWDAPAAVAHEGHAALPSKGATVSGNQLLLSAPARRAIGVKTAKITLGDFERVLRVNARVELPWSQQAMVTTLVPGKIERLLVQPGQAVVAGQELARIESLELETLQLRMLQAANQLELSKQLVDQRSGLVESGIVRQTSLLEAHRDLEQQAAELVIVRRKLSALGLERAVLDRVLSTRQPVRTLSITSPRQGIVAHVDVRIGDSVEPDQHLFNIVDTSKVLIVGEVLETDLALVSAGLPARVTFASLPGRAVSSQIDDLELKINEGRRTVNARVYADNADGLLRPGLFGRMEIQVKFAKDAILCPANALIEEGTAAWVLLEQGHGKFLRRSVKLGLRTKKQAEILDGLFPGDRVIVAGNQLLAALFTDGAQGATKSPASPRRRLQKTPGEPSLPSAEKPVGESLLVVQGSVEVPTGQKAFASSTVPGRIADIHVVPGQAVREGDLLAEVESQELRHWQLDLLQAQVRWNWTRGAIERLERLQGVAARKEIWPLQTELVALNSTVDSLTRKLSLAGLSDVQIDRLKNEDLSAPDQEDTIVSTLPIRAAIHGRLARFEVVPGQVIQPPDQLFEIHDTSTVWVKAHVFQREQAGIAAGQQAVVTFPADPNLRLTGNVVRTAPVLDERERVLPVWIELPNPDGFLKEGMLAEARIGLVPRRQTTVQTTAPSN